MTPSLVEIDMFPSSAVLPTLIKDDEKSVDISASATSLDNCGKRSDELATAGASIEKLGGRQLSGLGR